MTRPGARDVQYARERQQRMQLPVPGRSVNRARSRRSRVDHGPNLDTPGSGFRSAGSSARVQRDTNRQVPFRKRLATFTAGGRPRARGRRWRHLAGIGDVSWAVRSQVPYQRGHRGPTPHLGRSASGPITPSRSNSRATRRAVSSTTVSSRSLRLLLGEGPRRASVRPLLRTQCCDGRSPGPVAFMSMSHPYRSASSARVSASSVAPSAAISRKACSRPPGEMIIRQARGLVAGVPERVPLPAQFDDQVAGSAEDLRVA